MSADQTIAILSALRKGHRFVTEIAKASGYGVDSTATLLCKLAALGIVYRADRVRSLASGQMLVCWAIAGCGAVEDAPPNLSKHNANHAVFVPPARDRSARPSALAPRVIDHRHVGPAYLGEPAPGRSALDERMRAAQ